MLGLTSEIPGCGEWFSAVKYLRVQVVHLNQHYGASKLNPKSPFPMMRHRFLLLWPTCRQTSRFFIFFDKSEWSQEVNQRRLQKQRQVAWMILKVEWRTVFQNAMGWSHNCVVEEFDAEKFWRNMLPSASTVRTGKVEAIAVYVRSRYCSKMWVTRLHETLDYGGLILGKTMWHFIWWPFSTLRASLYFNPFSTKDTSRLHQFWYQDASRNIHWIRFGPETWFDHRGLHDIENYVVLEVHVKRFNSKDTRIMKLKELCSLFVQMVP